ncbi:MAG: hypothetical protein QGG40_09325 [Myxococcota bacterium]|nr:hypothetical protein [Myxococcota bacterium]
MIHDPLYRIRVDRDGEDEHLRELSAALVNHLAHPAGPALRELLDDYVQVPVPSILQVLQAHGPVPMGADPVQVLAQRLTEQDRSQHLLRERVTELEAEVSRLSGVANGLAVVGAMLAIFAVLGWLSALGWMPMQWVESPEVPRSDVGQELK